MYDFSISIEINFEEQTVNHLDNKSRDNITKDSCGIQNMPENENEKVRLHNFHNKKIPLK